MLTATRPVVVLKFGGTSVSTKARWDNIAALAKSRQAEGYTIVLVVSAVSGVTNLLQNLIDQAQENTSVDNYVAAIAQRHHQLCQALMLTNCTALEEGLSALHDLARDAQQHCRDYAWQAQVLALGELLSSQIGAVYLKNQGLDIQWLDARQWLQAKHAPNASVWSQWLSANCDSTHNANLSIHLQQAHIHITQGFIALNEQQQTVILGRGGSDTSAAYFGAMSRAARVEIWTDVAGMFSADPHEVPQARLLKNLDYEEAQEIATTGAKVLHARCISPLRETQIPLWIRDTNYPDWPGTTIHAHHLLAHTSIKALSMRKGITLIAMETVGMWQQVGFLADVFTIYKKHGLSIDLMSSSETNVTISLDPHENLLNTNVLEALCHDLQATCRVKVITPCAAITLVGRGMRAQLAKLSSIWSEFAQHHVHLISQSSNDLNITFVIDEHRANGLLPLLHDALIQAKALRIDAQDIFGASWQALYHPSQHVPTQPWWHLKQNTLLTLAHQQTPCYVYNIDVIQQQIRQLKAISPVDNWFYAMKANNHHNILQQIIHHDLNIECVSAAELQTVLQQFPNISRERILFTPNFAPKYEYALALQMSVHITLDALHPVQHWPELWQNQSVFLRLDLGYGRGHHQKVVTGGVNAKFGLPVSEITHFSQLARQLNLRIIGLHTHLGSGILEVNHFRETYAELASYAEQFPHCRYLNIGGGLGVPVQNTDTALNLQQLTHTLQEVKAMYPQYALWMEPGRYIVAEAGVLLSRVTQIKTKGTQTYVGLDAGMNSLIRPALYDAYHDIVNLSKLTQDADTLCQIVGPICESGDILGTDRYLPKPEENDIMLIASAGAYGAVMASRYNLREPATELIL